MDKRDVKELTKELRELEKSFLEDYYEDYENVKGILQDSKGNSNRKELVFEAKNTILVMIESLDIHVKSYKYLYKKSRLKSKLQSLYLDLEFEE